MKLRYYTFFLVLALLIVSSAMAPKNALAEDSLFFASIGSGGLDGGYNRTTRAICEAVHEVARKQIRCSPEVTPGSIYNLNGIANGELEFALVQSDWLHEAVVGGSIYSANGPNKSLRTVTGLYVEAFTLMARRNSKISSFRDLVGKRVDIGGPASGRRATMAVAMEAFGVKKSDFSAALELPTGNILQSLCEGNVDAVALVMGHPSPLVAKAISECDVVLVPVQGPEISALIADAPYYRETLLRSRVYTGQQISVPTFGVTATMVTSSHIPKNIVETIAATIVRDWEILGRKEAILANSSLLQMQSVSISAPLHAGAAAAFKKYPPKD